MQPRTIVVVEDEAPIAAAVAARLRSEGFKVEVAPDGLSAVGLCERIQPDLVVLDLMLPGLDGLEVCRRIQRERPVPVVMLTARDSESDLILGLADGADDYITKPFSPRELVARVHAVLRRVERAAVLNGSALEAGDLRIEPDSRKVWRSGEPVHLTPTEFDLLVCLAARPEAVFTREQLMSEVWGYKESWGVRSVDSHIRALRRKLGGDVVRTVHGVGYALGQLAQTA
jgi:DNA-binding response OmpR family regulator